MSVKQVSEQLAHLRNAHLLIVAISVAGIYLLLAQLSGSELSKELRAFKDLAAAGYKHPQLLLASEHENWGLTYADSIGKQLQRVIVPNFELAWDTAARRKFIANGLKVTANSFVEQDSLSLEMVQSNLEKTLVNAEFVESITTCSGDSVKQSIYEQMLIGRGFTIAEAEIKSWPLGRVPGIAALRIYDWQYVAASSRRGDSPSMRNVYRGDLNIECQFITGRHLPLPLAREGLMARRFPAIEQNWERIRHLRLEIAQAQAEQLSRAEIRNKEVSFLGIDFQGRYLGFVIPIFLVSIILYVLANIQHLSSYITTCGASGSESEETFLSPWVCTHPNWLSFVLGIGSLILLPTICIALCASMWMTNSLATLCFTIGYLLFSSLAQLHCERIIAHFGGRTSIESFSGNV